ncbi:MAG: glutamine synthetase [Rhodobacteraceae bacterium]|nr:glutamine synthetase [Paracoccaceae bacterium]
MKSVFAAGAELAAYLKDHPETEWLDALMIDLCGNAFGKRLPVSQAGSVFGHGTPVCAAMQLVDVIGNTADPMGRGFSDGDPDGLARALPGRIAPVPWSGGKGAQVLCEMTGAADSEPFWYEPRNVLRGVLGRFQGLGLRPVAALELEFYLIDPARADGGAPLAPASPANGRRESRGQVLSLAKLDEFAPVLDAIRAAARDQGLPVTTMISEYGAGQFEINLLHRDDILAAADDAALLRRVVQGAARAAGLDATFMSKPFAGASGNGLHIHLSLLDATGANVLAAGHPDGDRMLGHAVAGLQATMHEAMAIFAPNLNVYRRFEPDAFTPVTRDWGVNNRSVAFRVPASPDGASRRIEHRVAGAEANPYLVTAAVLAGVLYGIENRLCATEPHGGNAGSELATDLPLTMWRALDAMRGATLLPAYLGADYLKIYAEVKEAEFQAFMSEISAREYEWYL